MGNRIHWRGDDFFLKEGRLSRIDRRKFRGQIFSFNACRDQRALVLAIIAFESG